MSTARDERLRSVRTYFDEVDAGRLPNELFTPDFEFYFPKFGVGRGFEEIEEFTRGLAAGGLSVTHHRDRLKYLDCGSRIIVEGTTFGHDRAGNQWDGGATPGGRFCSVFDFNDAGLIQRMYVYMDPDYTGADKDRMRWNRAEPRW
jgi:hypothetical protein